ncbi:MAG: NUDIX domain-containing protein [Candidatus Zambryskibacteria bacterium]|nr:NUDIX domain-containing protein [Candidatus Zambryskibacteria bacterium]
MDNIKYKGKMFEIFDREIEREGKRKLTVEIARRSPGTRLIIAKGNKILLTKEYRHEIGEYDFRLPGGKVYESLEEYNAALESDANIMEAAKSGAIKEAWEEAGIKTRDVTFLQKSICGMTIVWELFYFLVNNFDEDVQHLEEDEDIQVEWIDRDKAREMCLNGSMKEERSALVLLKYLENRF